LFALLKARDVAAAQPIYDAFLPLETLRDSISLIRVLHDAVTLSGLADMGPHLPLLSASPVAKHAEIQAAAEALRTYNQGFPTTL
jgi:dihydrodipicolinate synthase/N-acetylneuraminate lyase